MRISARTFTSLCLLLSLLPCNAPANTFGLPNSQIRAAQASKDSSSNRKADKDTVQLTSGKPIERDLGGGQAHTYTVKLSSGQYLGAVVDQLGIDVVVTAFGPDGKRIVEVDSPNGNEGPEPVNLVAETPGAYLLEVRSLEKDAAVGRYRLSIKELRAATSQDRTRIGAERALNEGRLLANKQTEQSMRMAVEKFEQSVQLWHSLGNLAAEAFVLTEIGMLHNNLGEKQKAIEAFQRALPIRRSVSDRRGEAATLINLGRVYASLGETDKALDLFNDALQIARSINDQTRVAFALLSIGHSYRKLGEYQKALEYYGEALPLWRSLVSRGINDSTGLSYTLAGIGLAHDGLGDKRMALDNHAKALELFRARKDIYGEAYTLANMGIAYDALGDAQKAVDLYNQSLPLSRFVGDQSLEALTLYLMARVAREEGDLGEARGQIEAALRIVESLRNRLTSSNLRASYLSTVQDYYQFYIDLLMRLHQKSSSEGFEAAALEASERARARSLIELLAEARVDIRGRADSKLLERERSIQQSIDFKTEQLRKLKEAGSSEEQVAVAEKELVAAIAQSDQVQASIRSTSPHYADVFQPRPLSLTEIQRQALDPDTVVLEYSLGEERSFLWAVTSVSINSYELPKRSDIEQTATSLYQIIAHSLPSGPDRSARVEENNWYQKYATALSKMLLAPVAKLIANKRLLIVPDGVLFYVPFAALPISSTASSSLDGAHLAPLILEHEIVTVPSASTLAVLRLETASRKPATKALALFADPVFDESDPRLKNIAKVKDTAGDKVPGDLGRAVRGTESRDDGGFLPRLTFTRREAEAIISTAPKGEVFEAIDFKANKTVARSSELKEYRIVHFATHGLVDARYPELSGLVLSLLDEQGNRQDGFLRLHEVYNLNLPAEMVVLSACRTALGKDVRGEGMVGLTRGFMYAGAKRIVASLWKVDDQSTAELMKAFYQKMMKENMRPAAALRAAQVEMYTQKKWRFPYYWAAFVLQGEWR